MNRRTAVRNFIVFSAGASLLPSCLQNDKTAFLPLKKIRINGEEEKMMAVLTEAILPTTTTPGAKTLSTHLFVFMMVDDCFKKEDREKFVNGLHQFTDLVKNNTGHTLADATVSQREEILKQLENKKNIPEGVLVFYNAVKKLTIQHFTGSKYYLTNVRIYEMAPGRFHGSYPVAVATKI